MARVKSRPSSRYAVHNTLASIIIEQLKDSFIIQKRVSVSTNEVYLRFDMGLGNSLRIADNYDTGVFKFKFKLNSLGFSGYVKDNNYSVGDLDSLIKSIKQGKEDKIADYGIGWYVSELNSRLKYSLDSSGYELIENGRAYERLKHLI